MGDGRWGESSGEWHAEAQSEREARRGETVEGGGRKR